MPKPKPATHPCPKCNRQLQASGEVTIDGSAPLPVFQCDECTIDWLFDGETFTAALTFALDPRGKLLDPSAYRSK